VRDGARLTPRSLSRVVLLGATLHSDQCGLVCTLSHVSLFRRLSAWWNRDAAERAEEETRMTPHERDVAEEDFEGRKDDVATDSGFLAGGTADYERDAEPPPR
jgi:hypothetical protein